MRSKTLLQVLFVSILVIPLTYAHADIYNLPATLSMTEQILDQSVATPAQDHGATHQVFFPMADLIDQNQPDGSVYMAAFSQGDLAQSFQQTNANISGAGILLQPSIGSSDNVTIQLWDALPNAGGTMLADASATGTAGNWVDVYWTAVPCTPGTTYYIVFTGNSSLGIAGSTSNPYPFGMVFANAGYNPFPTFDYAFRTYWDDEVALERSTWANVKALFEE